MQPTDLMLILWHGFRFYCYLLTATALFVWRQKRRPLFLVRLLSLSALGVALMTFLYLTIDGDNLNNAAVYSSAMLMTALIVWFSVEVSWSEAVFCSVAGYSVQFVQSVCTELLWRCYPLQGLSKELRALGIGCLIYGALYYSFGRKLKKGQNFDLNKWLLLILLAGAVLTEIVICYNLRQQWILTVTKIYLLCDSILLLISSIAILTIQFTALLQRSLQNELEIIQQMLHKEQEQYQISRETIDLINLKCHDMRYQIRTIGQRANVTPDALQEMEEHINIYDSLYDTGSKALDIILTEKSMYCQKNGIVISCIADGEGIGFINDTDIYSLFGNLLDNAIRAVQALEADKRVIDLSIRRYGSLVSINSYNCFSGEICIKNGIPQTKGDPDYHGFGTKSMVAIVEKYGGTISFQTKDSIFNLNMLFPVN